MFCRVLNNSTIDIPTLFNNDIFALTRVIFQNQIFP